MAIEDDLKQSLLYDPDTGILTWAKGTRNAGNTAGHATKRGHMTVSRKGVLYQAHRVAWLLHYGHWPVSGIDHIDGNPGNNRIANLRDVGQEDNNKNKCIRRDSASKVMGVTWDKLTGKWRVGISIDKKRYTLGFFADFNKAVAVRKEAEQKFGYHPNHGRIQHL